MVPFDFADASVSGSGFRGRRRRVAASTVALDRHLLDIGGNTTCESSSIDATISDDVPPTVNVYVAPTGITDLSGTKFYGGIQTPADGYTRRDHDLRRIGPGFLTGKVNRSILDQSKSGGRLLTMAQPTEDSDPAVPPVFHRYLSADARPPNRPLHRSHSISCDRTRTASRRTRLHTGDIGSPCGSCGLPRTGKARRASFRFQPSTFQ